MFFNWNGGAWDHVGTIRAPHYTGYIAPPDLLRTTDGIIVC
ncbi:hypothetical protein V5P93_004494 [Actinokineospora auranticolor]|uniref:Uncharacterized protein n=1 Tax=Actinokineospora auranticolor TaxID=155976 RepID=A0A2S6GT82_9PSEU|nr:hypothetical protein [Actinokineospora auranticolor]PPK68399.1 hypothetical protein CLV40_105122 [Actinokineospora auranticolor]